MLILSWQFLLSELCYLFGLWSSYPTTAMGDINHHHGFGSKISQIEQVVSASLKPLPTETGDGTYVKKSTTTGLAKDLGHIDLKDVNTLAEVAKSGVTGDPVNDREYIMERIIQVSQCSVVHEGYIG